MSGGFQGVGSGVGVGRVVACRTGALIDGTGLLAGAAFTD
jgi:hypothetical protein